MNATKLFIALIASSAMTVANAQNGTDGCATPDPIAGQGSFAFDQSLATTGIEGQTETLCYAFGSSTIDNDVWFSWTADATGIATISTCTSTVDTKVAVYGTAGCPLAGTALACNDDSCGLQSSLNLNVTAGTAYTLQVGTFPGATGGFGNMDISISPPASNDDCTAPIAIAGQGSFPFSQVGASTGVEGQVETLCYAFGSSTVDNDVWYSWTADATGIAIIGTCTSSVDTKIAAYPGGGCPANGTSLACNDDACGLQSTMNFPVTAGTSYMLQVGTFPGATGGIGNFDVSIGSPVANDDCSAPIAIAGQGSFPFDNSIASAGIEGQVETICYLFGTSGFDFDVWFTWTADATGTAVIGTCNSSVHSKLAVYPGVGCPTNGTSIACDEHGCGNISAQVIAPVTSGVSYTIQLGVFPSAIGGIGNMDITIVPPLTADDCATPDSVSGQGTFAFDNTIATTGTEGQAETLCYAFGSSVVDNDVWFAWTADATGPATIGTCNSSVDTKIAIYPGSVCPTNGSSLACNDDLCGLQSEIVFPAVSGTTYMLQIGNFPGASGAPGTFDVSIQGPAEPGTPFCFCDSGNDPCGNGGAAGNGCGNSSFATGANLTGSGVAQVGADSLVLVGSGLRVSQPGLYFQGNNAISGGSGVIFGDGIRCAGQGVIRLGVAVADASGDSSTAGFATSVSVKGGVNPGDLKHYQLWYRDPGTGSPCGAEFNLTNGYSIQW